MSIASLIFFFVPVFLLIFAYLSLSVVSFVLIIKLYKKLKNRFNL